MLIATSAVALAVLAASPLFARPFLKMSTMSASSVSATSTIPPILVGVSVEGDVSPKLVARVLDEATEIWRPAGVAFAWQRDTMSRVTLRVRIGNETGAVRNEWTLPLGWIVFDDVDAPEPEIYVSYANATALMAQTRAGSGGLSRMPRAEQEALLGRAMGRALAHELGHYLLASKVHSVAGLMQARRTATEFFALERLRFQVDGQQRAAVAARLNGGRIVASR